MKYFAITDTHFGHSMLNRNGHRELAFEQKILDNLKKVKGDVLIHLGDFCIGKDLEWHKEFMSIVKPRFKKLILIRGNHDNKSYNWYIENGWDFICETMRMRINQKEVLFSHMPILGEHTVTPPYHKVDYNIHGHLHGNGNYSHRAIEGYDAGFHYDCAVDTHDYKAIELDKILK